jgi:signal peptidase II
VLGGRVARGVAGRRALLFAAILLVAGGCDHASKRIAQVALAEAGVVSLAAGVVQLELVANHGAFLSLGRELPLPLRRLVLLVLPPLLLALVCASFLRLRGASTRSLVGLACVAGGGLANWLDRLLHGGAVTDFVSLGVGPLRTGVFNLADVVIFAGLGVLLLAAGRRGRTAQPEA